MQSGLVYKVLKIGSGKSRGGSCNHREVHFVLNRSVSGMHLKYFFSSSNIRSGNYNLSVKSAGS